MENEEQPSPEQTKICFNYIKSNHFRVVHCDGAIGTPTPQGNIAASFFSERLPIPQQTTQMLEPDGKLSTELLDQRVQRDGIVREVEVEMVMSAEVAESVAKWLTDRVAAIRRIAANADAVVKEDVKK